MSYFHLSIRYQDISKILIACRAVKITYKNLRKPVTYIRDAMMTPQRVVELDAIPGFPPQGDGVGDVKGIL